MQTEFWRKEVEGLLSLTTTDFTRSVISAQAVIYTYVDQHVEIIMRELSSNPGESDMMIEVFQDSWTVFEMRVHGNSVITNGEHEVRRLQRGWIDTQLTPHATLKSAMGDCIHGFTR